MTPQRIQRRRAKGWRMPVGAVYVGRPTRWGNPYRVLGPRWVIDQYGHEYFTAPDQERGVAVRHYREDLVLRRAPFTDLDLEELRGKDLVCWCPLDQPCHADVLLELANGGAA